MKLGRSAEESIWLECVLVGLGYFAVVYGFLLGISYLIRGEFNPDAVSPVSSMWVAGLVAGRRGVLKAFRAGQASSRVAETGVTV